MKARMVRFEKVFNLGNYENARIGIEVELTDGETAAQAMEQAKRFVESQNPKPAYQGEISWARRVLANEDDHLVSDVKRAREIIENQPDDQDFPF